MNEQKNVDERPSKPLTRWRKAGDMDDITRIQWRAVKMCERVAYDENATRGEILTAAARMTQAVQCYLKVLEVGELEERVEALEESLHNNGQMRRAV